MPVTVGLEALTNKHLAMLMLMLRESYITFEEYRTSNATVSTPATIAREAMPRACINDYDHDTTPCNERL